MAKPDSAPSVRLQKAGRALYAAVVIFVALAVAAVLVLGLLTLADFDDRGQAALCGYNPDDPQDSRESQGVGSDVMTAIMVIVVGLVSVICGLVLITWVYGSLEHYFNSKK